jgi:uncharacterized protein YlxP (DUF503 family)
MVVGVGILEICIVDSRSLKEKRGVLRRIMQRTQNKFNVSIAEIGNHDSWKRGTIGFSVVGNDKSFVNSMMDTILKFIDDLKLAEVVSSKIEITTISHAMDRSYGFQNDKFHEF